MTKNTLKNKLTSVVTEQPATSEEFNLHEQLRELLQEIGLSPEDSGGSITFEGADPIVPSTIRLGAGSSLALVAKSVAAAKLWRMRGGDGQDIHIDLRKSIRRLSPSYEGKWETVNGYKSDTPDPNLLKLISFFKTKDGRSVIPANIYPKLRSAMLELLDATDAPESIAKAIAKWDGADLEKAGADKGIVMGMVRTLEEFMQEEAFEELVNKPLIEIEKIGESDPEPLHPNAASPLEGVRALGLGHVIAGSGMARALALHGADCLNVWRPNEFEHDSIYATANVGLRSARLDYKSEEGNKKLKERLKEADVFYANRRLALLEGTGLTPQECAEIRPGIIHCSISAHGQTGPWADRPGFDQVAGAVTGMMTFEGTKDDPQIPSIFVVNDYIVSWLAATGVMAALARRATEGGSYRVHVSLSRASLWLLSLGIFDKEYAHNIAGSSENHQNLAPDLFFADTPLGKYQGVTDQVHMSKTPGSYRHVLVPRGSSQLEWYSK
jgi:crotonobetainyl-CoA:carnitine CoA-transferase CaiB-like acyl-CoA transferase